MHLSCPFYLITHTFLSPPAVFPLSCPHGRCSLCSCSAAKASSGSRSGTCLCLTRRKRRSPESWCKPSWLGSPKCAASWSGETSRSCIRGGYEWEPVTRQRSVVVQRSQITGATIQRRSPVRASCVMTVAVSEFALFHDFTMCVYLFFLNIFIIFTSAFLQSVDSVETLS